jgi:molybdopterin/thiamine biosynthesis adenylyltransferase/rhodanese-related sulfurtransferase
MTNWPCFHPLPEAKQRMNSKRYDRQIALPEIGHSGQQKLADAKVLVVGAGGLGCPAILNLAAAGIGKIGIADGDIVEETNLHRQLLFTPKDCGRNKSEVAASVVSTQNPEIKVISYPTHFSVENAFDIVADYHIIVDCSDNLMTRYLINDVSLVKNIPMVYASIHKFEGQLSVFNYENGPSYRCLFPESENQNITNCSDAGVLGILPNVLGVLQATEVLKIVLGIGTVQSGKLLVYNGLNATIQSINFNSDCCQPEVGRQNGLSILDQKQANIKSIDAINLILSSNAGSHLIIDLREHYEEPATNLPNATNVPIDELHNYFSSVDKQQKIILFCQHGQRSLQAANYLVKRGFTDVSHLENGTSSLPQAIKQII